jgi:hypothetical protein
VSDDYKINLEWAYYDFLRGNYGATLLHLETAHTEAVRAGNQVAELNCNSLICVVEKQQEQREAAGAVFASIIELA